MAMVIFLDSCDEFSRFTSADKRFRNHMISKFEVKWNSVKGTIYSSSFYKLAFPFPIFDCLQ